MNIKIHRNKKNNIFIYIYMYIYIDLLCRVRLADAFVRHSRAVRVCERVAPQRGAHGVRRDGAALASQTGHLVALG